jgi:hypothetical protein
MPNIFISFSFSGWTKRVFEMLSKKCNYCIDSVRKINSFICKVLLYLINNVHMILIHRFLPKSRILRPLLQCWDMSTVMYIVMDCKNFMYLQKSNLLH